MDSTRRRFNWIDWLLLAAVIGLSAFLAAETTPAILDAWRNRPRPGVQVRRQCLVQDRCDSRPPDAQDAQTASGKAAETTTLMDYLLYLPRTYAARDSGRWPLLVFLHGSGERGDDLETVRHAGLPCLLEPDSGLPQNSPLFDRFIIVSPQCSADVRWLPERIMGLIDQVCREWPVDEDRVYLTGFSMGGFGTWDAACRFFDRFAAIAPLAGGGDVQQAERLKEMPIWAFHGAKDETVPADKTQTMVEAVRRCGGEAELTIYPDAGHGIWEETYRNSGLFDWFLAHRRNTTRENASAVTANWAIEK